MKAKLFLLAALLTSGSLTHARTWTSADGSKTFDGEIEAFDAASGKVTVTSRGKKLVFSKEKLSSADREFINKWKEEADKPSVEEALQTQKIGKDLSAKVLSRLNGKKFKKTDMEKAPEYYLLYFSASW